MQAQAATLTNAISTYGASSYINIGDGTIINTPDNNLSTKTVNLSSSVHNSCQYNNELTNCNASGSPLNFTSFFQTRTLSTPTAVSLPSISSNYNPVYNSSTTISVTAPTNYNDLKISNYAQVIFNLNGYNDSNSFFMANKLEIWDTNSSLYLNQTTPYTVQVNYLELHYSTFLTLNNASSITTGNVTIGDEASLTLPQTNTLNITGTWSNYTNSCSQISGKNGVYNFFNDIEDTGGGNFIINGASQFYAKSLTGNTIYLKADDINIANNLLLNSGSKNPTLVITPNSASSASVVINGTADFSTGSSNSQVCLAGGDYFFNNLNVGSSVHIDPIPNTGTVRIYVNGTFTDGSTGQGAFYNKGGDPSKMLIYTKNGMTIGAYADDSGLFISDGAMTVYSHTNINGAMLANSLIDMSIGSNIITYDPNVNAIQLQNNSGFGGGSLSVGTAYSTGGRCDFALTSPTCPSAAGYSPSPSQSGTSTVSGTFNVVNSTFTGGPDPISTTDVNALYTQVVNKPFTVYILSLKDDNISLTSATSDVNVTLISSPTSTTCQNAPALTTPPIILATSGFTGQSSTSLTFTSPVATQSASFRVQSGSGSNAIYACSRDVFAIRPNDFNITAPTSPADINLLVAGRAYNFSLVAQEYNSTAPSLAPSLDYNVSNITSSVITLDKTLYDSYNIQNPSGMIGDLTFAALFDITNGVANNMSLIFSDVGKVNIQLVDKTWAAVDINNGDTTADCSSNGAYICGDINATYIPAKFALTGVDLFNNDTSSGFTYLSNDLNQSAHLNVIVTAQNDSNVTTKNFSSGLWENPVNIFFSVKTPNTPIDNIMDINTNSNLGFSQGIFSINYLTDTNASQQLKFNFARTINIPLNPFIVQGTDINMTATSTYTSISFNTATVTGTNVADQNATFLYGRTHAPRYRFAGRNGNANISYEVYCFETDTNGNSCNLARIPSVVPSYPPESADSLGWYQNSYHNRSTDGNISTVIGSTITSSFSGNTLGIDIWPLTYSGSTFPYITTMQTYPSSWLLYNQYNASAPTNDFQVEFYNAGTRWTGKENTTTTTDSNASTTTSKRIFW